MRAPHVRRNAAQGRGLLDELNTRVRSPRPRCRGLETLQENGRNCPAEFRHVSICDLRVRTRGAGGPRSRVLLVDEEQARRESRIGARGVLRGSVRAGGENGGGVGSVYCRAGAGYRLVRGDAERLRGQYGQGQRDPSGEEDCGEREINCRRLRRAVQFLRRVRDVGESGGIQKLFTR